jgi:hypothetical protein
MASEVPAVHIQAIWENIVNKHTRGGREALCEPERVWWDVTQFHSMSDSGGFLHYFHISAGEDVQWLIDSLEAIGDLGTRRGVIGLCQVFPGGWPSSNAEEREEQVDFLHETIGEDELPWPEDLYGNEAGHWDWELLLWRYWIANSTIKHY